MENKQKNFIVTCFDAVSKMSSRHTGIHFWQYPISVKIKDGNVITYVEDKEYCDILPMKGSRRDRVALAKMVCRHICEAWGGTLEEVVEFTQNLFKDLIEVLNNVNNK